MVHHQINIFLLKLVQRGALRNDASNEFMRDLNTALFVRAAWVTVEHKTAQVSIGILFDCGWIGELRPTVREDNGKELRKGVWAKCFIKAIDNISLAAYTGNVIITGEEGMDTLSLAKNMVREIQATDSNFSGKVAKISGHALNKKDTADTLSKLKNGALIICKASEMNDATANVLHKALQQESQGIVIILEDTKRDIDKFLEKHEKLRECFTARMDVEALSNNTLVAFGKQYAREMEYSIDELGELALHTRIEDMQTIDHVVTVVDVKQIVDEAIAHANKKTLKHFFDVLFAKRYDDEDMIILTEKDFV